MLGYRTECNLTPLESRGTPAAHRRGTQMSTLSTRITTPTTPAPGYRRTRTATRVGILFVVQMVTAMFGTSSIQAFVDGHADRAQMTLGVLLMTGSGLAVVGIGLLTYP